ncbi:MAG: hypothetical protein KAG99_04675 [Bacteroidales bacterium]|nr:hypothetical protein [Bacteroidales bacterium]
MDTSLELKLEQRYTCKISDSSQDVIAGCSLGENVYFNRDHNLPDDKHAVSVLREHGEKIGYIRNDSKLARHLDGEGEYVATVNRIIGGPNLFQRTFGLKGKDYSCIIEIVLSELDLEKHQLFIAGDRKISKIILRAESHTKDNPKLAVKNYQQAINAIVEYDQQGTKAQAWRRSRIPVNKLSMMLEKQGKLAEALDIIDWYLGYDDYVGIDKYALDMIQKRMKRIKKKLAVTS